MIAKYVLPIAALAGLSFAIHRVIEAPAAAADGPAGRRATRKARAGCLDFRLRAGGGARAKTFRSGSTFPAWSPRYMSRREKGSARGPLFRIDDRDKLAQLRVREAELVAAKAQLHKLMSHPVPKTFLRCGRRSTKPRPRWTTPKRPLGGPKSCSSGRWLRRAIMTRTALPTWPPRPPTPRPRPTSSGPGRKLEGRHRDRQGRRSPGREPGRTPSRPTSSGSPSAPRWTAEILQLNVRLGQFAALTWKEPMIVLGDSKRLHLRVDIDEHYLPSFAKGCQGWATLKGRPEIRFPLKFVYVEPYVIPKQSLTGDSSERVDTRVLQVIYELPDDRACDIHIGQQMDVYLKAAPEKAISLRAETTALRDGP